MDEPTVLTLRLEGPMQAWGSGSKWDYRSTELFPTKSGVIGLLASALGLERGDPRIASLAGSIKMAVRADRPGTRMVDYQTVTGNPLRNAEGKKRSNGQTFISRREYLSDASFMVALEGAAEVMERVASALERPYWPYYLGRKNCVPSRPVLEPGPRPYSSLNDALAHHPVADRSAAELPFGCESDEALPDGVVLGRSDLVRDGGQRRFDVRRVHRGKVSYVSE